jgi:hypothetical protein
MSAPQGTWKCPSLWVCEAVSLSTVASIFLYGTAFQYDSKYFRNVTVNLYTTNTKNKRGALMTLHRLHDME